MNAIIEQNKSFLFYSEKQLSRKTVENYSNAVKRYLQYLSDNSLLMGFESVCFWLATIENPRTHNLNLQGIKSYLLKYFEDRPASELLELERGFKKIKRRKPKVSVDDSKYITYQEFEKLTAVDTVEKLKLYIRRQNELSGYTNKHLKKTILFIQALFWTGCRISELLNIKVRDCAVNGTVAIKILHGKGGKERLVYLQKEIFDQVRRVFDGEEYLFETRAGTKFNRLNITKDIRRLAKKVLERNISAHTLRHSKAMYLKTDRNLSADQISKALGHSSVVTTLQHYFHGTPNAADQGIV